MALLKRWKLSEKLELALVLVAGNRFLSTEQLDCLVQANSTAGTFRSLQRSIKQLVAEDYLIPVSFKEQMKHWPRNGGRRSFVYGLGSAGAGYVASLGNEITVGTKDYHKKQNRYRLSKFAHRLEVNHLFVALSRIAGEADQCVFDWESEDEFPAEDKLYSFAPSVRADTEVRIPFKPDGHAVFVFPRCGSEDQQRHFLVERDLHSETGDSYTYGFDAKTVSKKIRGYLEVRRTGGIVYKEIRTPLEKHGQPVRNKDGQAMFSVNYEPRKIPFGFTLLMITNSARHRDYLRAVARKYARDRYERDFLWFGIASDYHDRTASLRKQTRYQKLLEPIFLTASEDSKPRGLLDPSQK